MMTSAIEALYIFNQNNESILEHVYRSRPVSSRILLLLYLSRPAPRASVLYFPDVNPPTTLFSITHAGLLFFVPSSTDQEPLFVLEFLHRLCDVLEDFLGSPLLAIKIETSYDVVAQILGEMCDAGSVCNTEPNALRDVVNVPGWMDKLLGGVGLPGSSPSLGPPHGIKQQLAMKQASSGPAIPWRRANVKHTSNELYVDIVETLSVVLAPSGRPLAAFANGSILFTSKISGVPDLILNLSVPSGAHSIHKVLELPTFHPCIRLARWKERPGELSFVPPDGKFLLAGYEVNLVPGNDFKSGAKNLDLPVSIEVQTSLGPTGSDFEVRLIISSKFSTPSAPSNHRAVAFGAGGGRGGSGRSTPSLFGSSGGSSNSPSLRDVIVTIPIPNSVRNVTELRASRGEPSFSLLDRVVEWRISTKESAASGAATLRCTVIGHPNNDDNAEMSGGFGFDGANGQYDYDEGIVGAEQPYQSSSKAVTTSKESTGTDSKSGQGDKDAKKLEQNSVLMPTSAAVSFSVKGWLASGLKVESLNIDTRKSSGLGEGVKPVKGVKYLTVSKNGVETRC